MSRKISQQAASAFLQGRKFTKSNTRVYEAEGYWWLELHRNRIARRPVGRDWTDVGSEVCTHGWDRPVTHDRLNALPGVSVGGKEDVWLNSWPWDNTRQWEPIDRKPEPCKTQEETEGRKAAMNWIHRSTNRWPLQRKRQGEPILMYVVQSCWGAEMEVFCRPWAATPRGEIKVKGHKRILFETWEAFQVACDQAQNLNAPPLHKLAVAANEILEGK